MYGLTAEDLSFRVEGLGFREGEGFRDRQVGFCVQGPGMMGCMDTISKALNPLRPNINLPKSKYSQYIIIYHIMAVFNIRWGGGRLNIRGRGRREQGASNSGLVRSFLIQVFLVWPSSCCLKIHLSEVSTPASISAAQSIRTTPKTNLCREASKVVKRQNIARIVNIGFVTLCQGYGLRALELVTYICIYAMAIVEAKNPARLQVPERGMDLRSGICRA